MKKQIFIIGLSLIIFITAGNCTTKTKPHESSKTIKILIWNLENFNIAKSNNTAKTMLYLNTIKNYDIIFVQDIRDPSGVAFKKLCSNVPGYSCQCSSPSGRSGSRAQYGIIFKKDIKLDNMKDFNPDLKNRWEYPPVAFVLEKDGYKFTAYVIRTKEDNSANEIRSLEGVIQNNGNVVVIGDIPVFHNHYPGAGKDFKGWAWLINDNIDNVSGATDFKYDRIIVNSEIKKDILSSGIVNPAGNWAITNHYPVYMELLTEDK